MVPTIKGAGLGVAYFESSLERDFFVLLEFRGDVIRWDPQPVRLPLDDAARSYTPDVLVTYAKPGPRGMTEHRVLYEVKYRDELRAKWKEYRPRFKAASRYARALGWQFKLVTEREIRVGGLLWNAKFLLTYLYDEVTDGERALLRNTVTRLGMTTPQKVLEACSSNVWEQARLLNAFWHLVATAEIATDLDIKLTMASSVWCYD